MESKQILRVLLGVWCLLTITLSQRLLEYSVKEEQQPGEIIGNLLVDAAFHEKYQSSALNQIEFTFLDKSGLHNKYFQIGKRSGILKTATRLDRDTMCPHQPKCAFTIEIAVGPVRFLKVVKVLLYVLDINDNTPLFPRQTIQLTISEGKPTGIAANIPEATDIDNGENGVQEYKLYPRSSTFKIRSGGDGLQLILTRTLDRETKAHHELTIIAYDGGMPRKSGRVTVRVSVSDINDNVPQFENTTYKALVLENATMQKSILQVRARDADEGANGRVSYSFSKQSEVAHGFMFGIGRSTGVIYVRSKLKYRKGSSYKLEVIARDNGMDVLSSKVLVTIVVMDVNDHAPRIKVHSLVDGGGLYVTENSAKDSFVAHISVVDEDGGQNGKFECTLVHRSFQLLNLYAGGYKIVTKGSLDREVQDTHSLRIDCVDQGKPPLSSSWPLAVSVRDVNDNPPIFSQSTYFAKIEENNKIGKLITKVNATDKDKVMNGLIMYKLSDAGSAMVDIGSHSGIVTAKMKFDHELIQNAEIVVYAVDGGKDQFTATATILLTIVDANDERPKFSMRSYRFNIHRGEPAGSKVGRVYASDADAEPNNRFTYSIINERKISSAFTIDAQNGGIRTTRALPIDNTSQYTFTVTAKEIEPPWASCKVNVTVIVLDPLRDGDLGISVLADLPNENLVIILALTGSLVLLLLILVTVILVICRRRRARNAELRYVPGNLVRVQRRDADVIRAKGALLEHVEHGVLGKLFDASPPSYPSMEKGRYLTRTYSPSQTTLHKPTSMSQELNRKGSQTDAPLTAGGGTCTTRSIRADRRRPSQSSKSEDKCTVSAESRRKAADGACETRLDPGKSRRRRSSFARECQDMTSVHSVRRHRSKRDSDSACSADVSNSDSGTAASDDPERRHRRGRSRDGVLRSQDNHDSPCTRHDLQFLKAESLSSPDSDMVLSSRPDGGSSHGKDDNQPGSSGVNRIALVHPQRNGENQFDEEDQLSHSDSGEAVPHGIISEMGDEAAGPRVGQEHCDGDSDSALSDTRQELVDRARPEGQSQTRPPKVTTGTDKGASYQGSCVNDTDFYESDSESRGRNILV